MSKIYGNVVLVAGASSGMGKAIAEALSEDGYKVYGTSRKAPTEGAEDVQNQAGGFIKMIQLDVCSDESAKAAVDLVREKEGRIDILINCAGFALAGAVEDTTHEEAYREFNTNFFGIHRMCRYVAPIMRQNGKGLIINISSTAGLPQRIQSTKQTLTDL
ncbi:MAG: short-chain dehydrogenase/reductase [Clostridia bacterium]|nr:short-chain dehydrogenase/reductase [Clostridia bacterium]